MGRDDQNQSDWNLHVLKSSCSIDQKIRGRIHHQHWLKLSFLGTPLRSAYTASKWGLVGLTKTWAMEYGQDKIRTNVICPTSVSGDRIEGVIQRDAEYRETTPEKIREAYLSQNSLKTFIESDEIVGMVIYLLSPLAKNISGQMLVIDGHTETLAMPEIDQ